jgi:hypothetical protein
MALFEDLSRGVRKGLMKITGRQASGKRRRLEYSFDQFTRLDEKDLEKLAGKKVTITGVTCILDQVVSGEIPEKAEPSVKMKEGIDGISPGKEVYKVNVASVLRVFNGHKFFKNGEVEELSFNPVFLRTHEIGKDSLDKKNSEGLVNYLKEMESEDLVQLGGELKSRPSEKKFLEHLSSKKVRMQGFGLEGEVKFEPGSIEEAVNQVRKQRARWEHVKHLRGKAASHYASFPGEHMPLGSITVVVRDLNKESFFPPELSPRLKKQRFLLELHSRSFHDGVKPKEGMKRVNSLHKKLRKGKGRSRSSVKRKI